jgi:D-aminopeptidase
MRDPQLCKLRKEAARIPVVVMGGDEVIVAERDEGLN